MPHLGLVKFAAFIGLLIFCRFTLATGPVTNMGHLKIHQEPEGSYLLDLTLPFWLAQDLIVDELPDESAELQEDITRSLTAQIFSRVHCPTLPPCNWQPARISVSPDTIRVRRICKPKADWGPFCFKFEFLRKSLPSFYVQGTLIADHYSMPFKASKEIPWVGHAKSGAITKLDEHGQVLDGKSWIEMIKSLPWPWLIFFTGLVLLVVKRSKK